MDVLTAMKPWKCKSTALEMIKSFETSWILLVKNINQINLLFYEFGRTFILYIYKIHKTNAYVLDIHMLITYFYAKEQSLCVLEPHFIYKLHMIA